ncbi:uncharacterized protein LOC122298800 [Carya illinoinensis]|uniref:uncharacterized protein LOC122298800 n=1 Tax=Carya illinoinensis TaxID=32201 RepID=UPI001C72744A|nr:uncharacterized protein LOC122298800 [Carya illinoinensis]
MKRIVDLQDADTGNHGRTIKQLQEEVEQALNEEEQKWKQTRIRVNGEAIISFNPSRGIRQGDSLSPYLFIIVAGAFSCLLNQAELKGSISSIPIGAGSIRVNHLFFADDSLLFCKANSLEWSRMLYILEVYEKASRQVINKDKTSIFFSSNTLTEIQNNILNISGVKASGSFEKYLGLPTVLGKSKGAAFHSLIDRTWQRITNWKTKFLSAAGKELLMKAVLQAIPTYTMGIFMLPVSISKRINQLLRKFWWGFEEDHTKVQWVKWDQLSLGKEKGGLGFRDIKSFNLAMLAKQSWRLLQYPSSLLAQILKQKYFPNGALLDSKLGSRPSYAWKSIQNGLHLLKEGLVWRIGNGKRVNIWEDKWIPQPHTYKVSSIKPEETTLSLVADLIDPDMKQWKEPILHSLLSTNEVDVIKSIPISIGGRDDQLVWNDTKNSKFSVSSAYHLDREMESRLKGGFSHLDPLSSVWKTLWKLPTTLAVRMFVWKTCSEALPTMTNLMRRHIVTENYCPICKLECETTEHALWSCEAAKDILSKAFGEIEAYKSSQDHQGSCPTSHNEGSDRVWLKPPASYYKLNWDAALNSAQGLVGIGAILRDNLERSIGTLQARRELNLNLFSGEAYALMMSVVFCKEIGVSNLVVEGDALQVIWLLNGSSLNCSCGGLIVEDAKRELNNFANWSAVHTKREGNKAAHALARNALTLSEDLLELELTPICIQQIVTSEMSVMSC